MSQTRIKGEKSGPRPPGWSTLLLALLVACLVLSQPLFAQPHPGFVDERGGLQCLAWLFPCHLGSGDSP